MVSAKIRKPFRHTERQYHTMSEKRWRCALLKAIIEVEMEPLERRFLNIISRFHANFQVPKPGFIFPSCHTPSAAREIFQHLCLLQQIQACLQRRIFGDTDPNPWRGGTTWTSSRDESWRLSSLVMLSES